MQRQACTRKDGRIRVNAMIMGLREIHPVEIIKNYGPDDIIVEFNGIRYTAVYISYTELYYVDDIFGKLE